MTEEKKATKEAKSDEVVSFKGRFTSAVGRRKRAIAQVHLYQNGKGAVMVNNIKATDYFPPSILPIISQPLKLAGHMKDFNMSIHVSGGGIKGQAEAVRHGISRALVKIDSEIRPSLKTKGYLTRDARRKERKKPGLKKARRAPQWSKR